MKVIKQSQNNTLLLIFYDTDLEGKHFEEGEKQLDLSSFQGEEITEEEALLIGKKAQFIQGIGEKSIAFGKKHGFFAEIQHIQSIPYAFSVA